MDKINKRAGENIRKFIESKKISNTWVIKRTGIGKTAFYDMLNGKGRVDVHVEKLNKLFGIKDPTFFYKLEIDEQKVVDHLDRKGNFLNYVASTHGEIDEKLTRGFEVFLELVELTDVLKSSTKDF